LLDHLEDVVGLDTGDRALAPAGNELAPDQLLDPLGTALGLHVPDDEALGHSRKRAGLRLLGRTRLLGLAYARIDAVADPAQEVARPISRLGEADDRIAADREAGELARSCGPLDQAPGNHAAGGGAHLQPAHVGIGDHDRLATRASLGELLEPAVGKNLSHG